jgi:transketolase
MRDHFARALSALSVERDDLFLVTADISPASALAEFVANSPGRVIDAGVAEQAMIGICAGLAIEGFRPFAYSIANFSVMRPYEHIRVDIAYQDLPVTIVGVGVGLSYSALGATHHTVEDVSLMYGLPNMKIVTPCDPCEVGLAMLAILSQDSPAYLRMGKSGEPKLTAEVREPYELGVLRCLNPEALPSNSPQAIVTYGTTAAWVLEVLAKTGKKIPVFAATSVRPFPRHDLIRLLNHYQKVLVVEDQYENCGLYAIARVVLSEIGSLDRLKVCGLRHMWSHSYGTEIDVRASLGLDSRRLGLMLEEADG